MLGTLLLVFMNRFIKKDGVVLRLFPGRDHEMVFNQNSTSNHAAGKTPEILQSRHVKIATPFEWMPTSPDCAPMDYGIWSIPKQHRLQYTGLVVLKDRSNRNGTNLSSRH